MLSGALRRASDPGVCKGVFWQKKVSIRKALTGQSDTQKGSNMPKSEERMPATGAGLIRYFQEEGHGVKISPKAVLAFTAAVIIFTLILHIYGPALLAL